MRGGHLGTGRFCSARYKEFWKLTVQLCTRIQCWGAKVKNSYYSKFYGKCILILLKDKAGRHC